MTFDEWLDEEERTGSRVYVQVIKLVRAQRQMNEKLLAELDRLVVLGPNSRKLMDEIDALEAALMGDKRCAE